MGLNSFCRVAGIVLLLLVWSAVSGAAQSRVPQPTIAVSQAGDCRVTVEVPARTRGSRLDVELNKGRIAREQLDLRPLTVVLPLGAPLQEGDELRARLENGPWHSTRVGAAPDPPSGATCGTTAREPGPEARLGFEALGFLGGVYDQFAPAIVGNYLDESGFTESSRSRFSAGVDLDYRVFGSEEDNLQFWVAAKTLYGLRSSDVDCREALDSPVCQDKGATQDQFRFILEHASTVEAHFSSRLEFWTIQPDSATPLRVFAGWQSGFVHLTDAPKVAEMDHVGLGVIASAGPFRGSSIEWSWARSSLFQSNAKWNRFKVGGVLKFDLVPSLRERLAFWKYGGLGALRGFIQIAIDRNPRGPGPDSVQTYIGFAFDFRRAFRP